MKNGIVAGIAGGLSATYVNENRGRPHPSPLPKGEGIFLPWAIFTAMTDINLLQV